MNGWEKAYQLFEVIPWDKKDPPEVLKSFHKIKTGKMLDLGCGTGNFSYYFFQRGFTVIGLDVSPTAINIARKRYNESANLKFLVGSGENLDFQDNNFDVVLCCAVLHHLECDEREAVLAEIKRILKRGGFLIATGFSEKDQKYSGIKKKVSDLTGTIYYKQSKSEFLDMFNGFSLVEYKHIEDSDNGEPDRVRGFNFGIFQVNK